jgi:hypothetical protein
MVFTSIQGLHSLGPLFERFFKKRGPERLGKKTSKKGLDVAAHIQPNISFTEVMQSGFLLVVTAGRFYSARSYIRHIVNFNNITHIRLPWKRSKKGF